MSVHTRDDWAHKLESLHQAAIAVAAAHDVEEALQKVADAARAVIGAQMAAIGVPGEPGEPMAHFVVSGLPREAVERAGHPPMGRGVLGVMLRDAQSVRLRQLDEHPEYAGLPPLHPSIQSFLGVPVQAEGTVVGDLYLANKIAEDEFSDEDQLLAEMLAAHAAVSIQTLRYHRKNEEMAVVQARARLAPKIEDDVLQTLYGAGLLLGTLDLAQTAQAAEQVREIQARLDTAIKHLRAHLLDMASPDGRNGG